MNYLAHIYLSGDDQALSIGNFMADHVKGSKYKQYPLRIQQGILLHRQIDSFTDQDPIVKRAKSRLNSQMGHYRGVAVDIIFDHFLARNFKEYSEQPLADFAQEFYAYTADYQDFLPDRILQMLPYMIRGNWLLSYADIEGIASVFQGLDRRTGGKGHLYLAVEDLRQNYGELALDFREFFEKLRTFSAAKLEEIERDFSNE